MYRWRAFIDESSDDIVAFLMGGWLARFDEWEFLAEAWDLALKTTPGINYFSHYEANSLSGEFTGWSEEARDRKLMAMAKVIKAHDVIGVVAPIDLRTFKEQFSGSILKKRALRNIIKYTEPYHYAFNGTIALGLGHAARTLNIGPPDRVDFIFDKQDGLFHECQKNYPELLKTVPPDLQAIAGTVLDANDKEVVALQSADLLVGQVLLSGRKKVLQPPLAEIKSARNIYSTSAVRVPESMRETVSKLNVAVASKRLREARFGKKERREER